MYNGRELAMLKLILLLSFGAGVLFGVDFVRTSKTKHNLYRTGKGELYQNHPFFAFCFACHVPNVLQSQFNLYAMGVKGLKEINAFPTTLACLSCHDGFIAPSVSPFNLKGHHPVFVEYEPAPFHLRPLSTPLEGWINAQRLEDVLKKYDYKLQCGVCHEPHTDIKYFLRRSNERSALCLSCHEK